jgi:predicted RNA methylase
VRRIGSEAGVKVAGVSEVRVEDRYPDIVLHLDSYKLLVQIKVDSLQRMLDDLVKTYPIAAKHGAGLLLLLLPSEVRRIHPAELEKAAPLLRIRRAVALAPWISKHVEEATLESVLRVVVEALKEYRRVLKPSVDYSTIAYVARESVEELAGILRKHILATPRLLNQAQGVIGRFDFYKALLSEAVEREEVMNTYVADIVAYLTVLYLLFIHIASIKKYGNTVLPRIENPLQPQQNLLDSLINGIKGSGLIRDYGFAVEPSIYILEILKSVEKNVSPALTRYIFAIQVLRPEHVREELFGRIYQESIPPETRKNLGAFFTNPVAARILAYLAVERWDDRVLDPACGSGTLLASAYEAKMEKALAQGIDRRRAHELFIKEHITGIDIMQFSKSMTSVNLALQEVEAPIEPAILWGDGIEKMVSAIKVDADDPPQQASLYDFIVERDRKKYLKHLLPREGFDVVIMNPPFTRRERIPKDERKRLEKMLGKIVKGKVGYWAYFFVASDNVIRVGGRLAAVTPEEFFVGSSAESVRRYLLLGEVAGRPQALGRVYVPEYIVKSVRQVAFSEGASYRDYLVVFRKVPPQEASPYTVIVLLKKRLDELKGREREVADAVRRFAESEEWVLRGEDFDAVKLGNVAEVVRARIDNLKPLVAFHTVEAYRLYEKIARELSGLPTLRDLESKGLIQIHNYNPGQFTARGKHVEDYATRLFIRRYGSRGKVLFDLERVEGGTILLKAVRGGTTIKVGLKDVVPALRSVAGVRYLDLTGREEYALVNPDAISPELLRSIGLVDYDNLREAARDIRDAYGRYSGEILLARRFRVTSPNVYFIALYSSNRMLSPATMNILRSRNLDRDLMKALVLYLNSTLALFQLLSLFVETEGAWIRFDKDVWADIHVPDLELLVSNRGILEKALNTFKHITEASEELRPLYERVSSGCELQRRIDVVALEMLGLKWDGEFLSKLYTTVKSELNALRCVVEESQRKRGRSRKSAELEDEENDELESGRRSLTEWFGK